MTRTDQPASPSEPRLAVDTDLPIGARAPEIAAAIERSQVVVIAGETGSGKTTQLPKICLQLGRRTIAHTQPRRIAARSVAERVAEETGTELGDLVGYQVRFTRKASRDTRLTVMTDGILLAAIGHDRMLRRYDTIIIDEAHERSLNIDFLLGYLKQLLPRRPDLKLIVTSATIDTARFAEHFADADGRPAPIVEVSGRTYPVQLRYRPLVPDPDPDDPDPAIVQRVGERDQTDAICEAVTELLTEPGRGEVGGDILVFCSGEREIRDAADALAAMDLPRTEILPLYARLSAAEQHRVFTRHAGRRIVLATNVAETSLTVPGIRYVIDPGTARISRWSVRSKVQRLPIEPISQASANQRAGRCGRLGPGVCIRLYSEADYESRPEFTEPEILRTNLASVILQMADARLGDIESFPFVEPPNRGQISDGVRLLTELGALAPDSAQRDLRLSRIGRRLARLPLDPRLGRMLLAAEDLGCLREVLVIVAGLTIQDPRERPSEQRERADALHRRFWAAAPRDDAAGKENAAPESAGSDFLAWIHLWEYLRRRRHELSGNAYRRMCRDEFLNFLRIREWQDLHTQLRDITKELGMVRNERAAAPEVVHTALLSGLLSQIGLADLREEDRQQRRGGGRQRRPMREYLGARGVKFAIQPGSALSRTPPPLVMAAELVETTRLWARTVAGIEAEQVEAVGEHLLKRQYSEPYFSERTGSVMAHERVSLLGVPIIADRVVPFARIDPVESRRMFIQAALVEQRWRTRHHFFARNAAVRAEAEALEERSRRRDVVVDDAAIFAFYDARIPPDVVSGTHFDRWWRDARRAEEHQLDLTLDQLVDAGATDADAYPEVWTTGGHELSVDYTFDPGSRTDGVTVEVPLQLLNQVDEAPFSWHVPGVRVELATELIRGLPKQLRTLFVPAPDQARRAVDWLSEHGDRERPFALELGRALRALTGHPVPDHEWRPDALPDHLRIRFQVAGEGSDRGAERDLATLRGRLAGRLDDTLRAATADLERTGLTAWDLGDLPREVRERSGGHEVVGYPALRDEVTSVGVAVAADPVVQSRWQAAGLRRLLVLTTPDPTKWATAHLSTTERLALGVGPYRDTAALMADARLAAVGPLVTSGGTDPDTVRDRAAFDALRERIRPEIPDRMRWVVARAAEILGAFQQAQLALRDTAKVPSATVSEVRDQIADLVFPGFLAAVPVASLERIATYLRAAEQRLVAAAADPARDARLADEVAGAEADWNDLVAAQPAGPLPPAVDAIGWQLEELRVSLFAQRLGARGPVSVKRIRAAVAALR